MKASSIDPLVDTLSETNNTYRTLLSTFICAFVYKLGASINEVCLKNKITFLQENKDWILLTVLILLFVFSYVKQTSYVRKRVESVLERKILTISEKFIIHSYGASVINTDNKLITLAHIGRIIWINQKIERKANTATNNL